MRGPALDLKRKILDRIADRPGCVWTPVDFLDLGSRAAVDKALQRLATGGQVRRLGRGLYDLPTRSGLTGRPMTAGTRAVIEAISRRDQARLLVDGMTAANDLGLTTAVPAKTIVLTDARLRTVKLGSQEIRFKQVAPSKLYWAGRPGMRVVQALYWLKDVLPSRRDDAIRRLRSHLADHPQIAADLRAGLHTLPAWMQGVVRELLAGKRGRSR